MKSVVNILNYVNDNWTYIVIVVGLITSLGVKINNYMKLSKEERINAALKAASETILDKITKAEFVWSDYVKSGAIKRSEVIAKIYSQYPILKQYVNQDLLIKEIDIMINEGLDKMKEVLKKTEEQNANEMAKGHNKETIKTTANN